MRQPRAYAEALHAATSQLYSDSVLDEITTYKISDKIFSALSAAWERAVRFIHRIGAYRFQDLAADELQGLTKATNAALSEAVDFALKDSDIPPVMQQYLQSNVFIFSGFKTHTELTLASSLLRDEDGKIKPFNRFLNEIKSIDNTYNRSYLQAEYNFAVSSAQAAAKWQAFAADGDDILLQYRTAKDERVREQHRLLDGITLPASDSFWDKYFAPNGWNCRCNVVQVSSKRYKPSDHDAAMQAGDAATYLPDSKGRNRAAIFRFNSGKQQIIFPPNHPYYSRKSKSYKEIKKILEDIEESDE